MVIIYNGVELEFVGFSSSFLCCDKLLTGVETIRKDEISSLSNSGKIEKKKKKKRSLGKF